MSDQMLPSHPVYTEHYTNVLDGCAALNLVRVLFSHPDGATVDQFIAVNRWIESAYPCGSDGDCRYVRMRLDHLMMQVRIKDGFFGELRYRI